MGAMGATKFTLLLMFVSSVAAFKVVSKTKDQDLRSGQKLQLSCKADSAFEYCRWRHRELGGGSVLRECNLEWKYNKAKVIKTSCDAELSNRTSVAGDYEGSHECGLTITDIRPEDAGDWECELEEYVLGDFIRGTKHKQDIKVTISAVTTRAPVRTTTTTKSTTASTSERNTEAEIETTTLIEDLSIKYDEVETESQPNTSTEPSILRDEEEIKVEALPVREAEEAEGSSAGLIAGVIVSLLAMISVLAALAITWVRRRKSQRAIISYLQTERDDQMASSAFLEEAEYHISIIRDPQNLPLQQQKTIETVTETDKL